MYSNKKKDYDNLLKDHKRKNYAERLRNSDNKNKCTWKIINEIKGKSAEKNIKIEGNKETIANNFNDFLINVAPNLLSKLNDIPFNSEIEYNPVEIKVELVNSEEILQIVTKLKNKFTCGFDEISNSLIKFVISEIMEPLVYIINNSIKYGIFPEQLKIALVIPVYKKGDETNIENYRPISLLSSFSKIFEHVMCQRILGFMVENGLLNTTQHGYLHGKSTQTAIVNFVQHIIDALENNEIPLGLFLDLSKAYDTLNHNILVHKLNFYGIRGTTLKWIKSYLSCREQRVVIGKGSNRVLSQKKKIRLGIPQGSVMGPILFILYVNNITELLLINNKCKLTNYADDTNILLSNKDITDLEENAKIFMLEVEEWFTKNRLVMNNTKTNIMIFKTSRSRLEEPTSLNLNGSNISLNAEVKFLGMFLDSTLSWECHVNHVVNKLNRICYSLRVLGRYIPFDIKKILYHANFESHIRYGIIMYGNCRDAGRIFVCQKRALRIILNLNHRESCRGKFTENKLLTATAVFIQECILFLFKNRSLFERYESQTVYATRTMNYTYPGHRLTMTEKGAHYQCIKLYNTLPNDIKVITNLKILKKKIFRLLLKIEPYNIEEFYRYFDNV